MRGKTVKFPTRDNTNFIPWILVSVKWCTLFGHKQGLLYSNDEKISIILIAATIIENYVIILLCDLIYIVDRASVVSIGFLSHRPKKECYNTTKSSKHRMTFKGLSFYFKNSAFYSNI